jgi:hypothetical protein
MSALPLKADIQSLALILLRVWFLFILFAYAFATFFRSGLPLIASRANRSARSLAVSRRVACSLASYAEAAFTPSCFHRNKRSTRSFFIEGIEGMIDNALL